MAQLEGVLGDASRRMGHAQIDGSPEAWQEAQGFMESALRDDPDNGQLMAMLGRLHLARSTLSTAGGTSTAPPPQTEGLLTGAIERMPDDPDPRAALVQFHQLVGQHDQALQTLDWLRQRQPDELWWPMLTARSLYQLGRLDEAEPLFRSTSEAGQAQRDIRAWVSSLEGLGDIHVARGEHEQAQAIIQQLEQAGTLNEVHQSPSASCVYFALGEMYAASGSTHQAAERYAQAADLEPSHVGHQLDAAEHLLGEASPVRALLYLERATGKSDEPDWQALHQQAVGQLTDQGRASLATAPSPERSLALALAAYDDNDIHGARLQVERAHRTLADPRAQVLLGFVFLQQRAYGPARQAFRQASFDASSAPGATLGMAHLHIVEKAPAAAQQQLEPILRDPPPLIADTAQARSESYAWLVRRMALLGMGWACTNQNQHPQALEHFERLLTDAPDDILALLGAANSRSALGQLDQAAAGLERVLVLDPGNQYGLAELALVRFNQGRLEESERLFDSALQQAPEGYTCPYEGLGLLYLQQGRPGEAKEAFTKAIAINPDIEYLKYNGLARLYMQEGQLDKAEQLLRKSISNYPYDPEAERMLQELQAQRAGAGP